MQSSCVDRNYWNIVKGFGILLVVLGHIDTPATDYIYLFHMPFFFFISGYLYHEEKYGDDPFIYLAARLKSSWVKYVLVYWIFILLHNLFVNLRIAEPDAQIYSEKEMFYKLSEAVFGMGSEFLAGPLWFVPVSVIAAFLLGCIISISRRVAEKRNSRVKFVCQAVLTIMCGIFGYYLMIHRYKMPANMHISFLVVPFLWGGYLLRTFGSDFQHFLHPVAAVLCAILLLYVNTRYKLELVLFMRVYPMMHLVAFMGIYVCLYIAKIIQHIRWLNVWFEWSGRASFVVMAVHYSIFRLFDWSMAQILCPEDPIAKYLTLPNSFPEYKIVYLIIGFVFPVLVYIGYMKGKNRRNS